MTFSLLALGFVLGLRHALDADHLVAVATIVSERKTLLSSGIVGALWGIGHTFSLLVVGIFLLSLDIRIPGKIALGAELGVAMMLVGLGVRVLWSLARGKTLHTHTHMHGGYVHSHPHVHGRLHELTMEHGHHRIPGGIFLSKIGKTLMKGKSSVLVGMVHGLAGSGGLMLVVAATIPSFSVGMLYVLAFGLGSIGGMLLMSTLLSTPFILTSGKLGKIHLAIRGLSGLAGICFGLFLVWKVGFVEGLFL